MSVDIDTVTDTDTWDGIVDRAEATTPFHRFSALEVFAEHTGTELHPIVGYVGQEPVGLLPVFERRIGPISVAFSPPPNRKITYLGPATLGDPNMKRRKRERRHRRFVEGALEYVDSAIAPRFLNVRAGVDYDDPRPFVWNEFTPTPRYTYHVDLTRDPDDLLADVGSDLRSNVRKTDPDAFEITNGGRAGMEQVVRNAERRHEAQDVSYGVTPEFVRDLGRAIPDAMSSYVCTVDGKFAGGTIALEDDDTVYRWQSVADFDAAVPAQDLLDWHVITEGHEAGAERYDLVGANNRRLCEYKAKFAPDVETYYRLQRSGVGMSALADLYTRLR